MRVARFWRLKSPSEWDALSGDDKARMIADYESEMTVQSWEAHLQNEDAKKQEVRAGKG